MARQQNDHLFKLIKSLTKSEKRNFKLYVNRIGGGENTKFLTLFDAIEKQNTYNEEEILKKNKTIKATQLSNLKANLNKNLLVSLRLMAQQNDVDIMLRQQLDFSKILYNKALYRQSLITLNKAKKQALRLNREILFFEMVEFEKQIESQYVTRSIETRADELTAESHEINNRLSVRGALSNLAIKLYGFYIRNGYIRDEEDQIKVTDYFHHHMPSFKKETLGFYEKLYLYQSHVWYYFILQDFLMVYRYAYKWVELFTENPEAKENQTDLYIKGINNMLDGLYYSGNVNRFEKELIAFGKFRNNVNFQVSKNVELLICQYFYTHTINWHFQEGKFTEGVRLIPEIIKFLDTNAIYLDNHVVLVFYYKIACMYFGSADYKNCVKYLNQVINYRDDELRQDIQCFARILNLISHFEMKNYELIEYLVKTTYRFISRLKDLHRVQKEIIFFLRRLPQIPENKLNHALTELLVTFKYLRNDPLEKRPFLYLDIISWIESKLSGISVQEVIRQKRTGKFELNQ